MGLVGGRGGGGESWGGPLWAVWGALPTNMAVLRGLLLLLPCGTLVTSVVLYSIIALTIIAPVPSSAKSIEDEFESKELQTRTASQCFHVQGVPVINLRCGRGEFIRVIQAFYGASTPQDSEEGAAPRSATCTYSGEAGDCVQYTSLKATCIGKSVCTVAVSNPFLSNCEQYASYMQVNYTCVPRVRIHDICEQSEVTTWLGYIATPRYPSPYFPNAHCQCSLKTQDRSILLSILDFSLNRSSRGGATGKCTDDRLHIEGWGDKCNPVVPEGLPETLGLREQALTLRFETDERRQGRGFWLEFRGSNGGKVTMTCGQRPSPSPTTDNNNNNNNHNNNLTPPNQDNIYESASSDNESTSDFEDTTDNNVVLVDDGEPYRPPPDSGRPPPEEVDNEFDTYDFTDHADQYQLYNVGDVQLATGIVVSVLILVAVIIIIVLVFRR